MMPSVIDGETKAMMPCVRNGKTIQYFSFCYTEIVYLGLFFVCVFPSLKRVGMLVFFLFFSVNSQFYFQENTHKLEIKNEESLLINYIKTVQTH